MQMFNSPSVSYLGRVGFDTCSTIFTDDLETFRSVSSKMFARRSDGGGEWHGGGLNLVRLKKGWNMMT